MDSAPQPGRVPAPVSPGGWTGRALILISGALVLAVVGALAVGLMRGVGGNPLGQADAPFRLAPDFSLSTFGGATITLSEFDSRPVFLYYWASWCAPCRQEAPVIERLWPEYRDRGYMFIGVNVLDRDEDAEAFIEEFGLSFPSVSGDGQVYLNYGVVGLPEAFFLRPAREVVTKYIGPLNEGTLREQLDRLQ